MIGRQGSEPVPAISQTRFLFLVFIMSLTLPALVLLLRDLPPGTADPVGALALIAAVAAMAAVGITVNTRRPWRVSDAGSAVSRLATDTICASGFAMAPALVAFVLCVMTGEVTTYLVGYALSLLLFILGAPTARAISRRREELARQGSTLDLAQALYGPPARDDR